MTTPAITARQLRNAARAVREMEAAAEQLPTLLRRAHARGVVARSGDEVAAARAAVERMRGTFRRICQLAGADEAAVLASTQTPLDRPLALLDDLASDEPFAVAVRNLAAAVDRATLELVNGTAGAGPNPRLN